MNFWLKTCISEGNPGAKLEDALRSPGAEIAGQERTSRQLEKCHVFYFYLFFFSLKALVLGSECLDWIAAWLPFPHGGSKPCQGPAAGAELLLGWHPGGTWTRCSCSDWSGWHRRAGMMVLCGPCMAGDHRSLTLPGSGSSTTRNPPLAPLYECDGQVWLQD